MELDMAQAKWIRVGRGIVAAALALGLAGCGGPAPAPTAAPEPEQAQATEAAVQLIAPLAAADFPGSGVTLEWRWNRRLQADERFDVRVWRPGEPANGITWVTVPYLGLGNYLASNGPGEYQWTVVVVRVEKDRLVSEVSQPAEVRSFQVADVSDPVLALTLPAGFKAATVYQAQNPTALALDAAGTMYVSQMKGDVLALTPAEQASGQAHLFAAGLEMPTGLLAAAGQLFVSSVGQVTVFEDTNGDGQGEVARQLFEAGVLPGRQYDSHSNNGMAIGPDGKLYLAIGGTAGKGAENHPLGGVILRYDLATGQYEVFARGLRNPYTLAFDPDGRLFAPDNGPEVPDYQLPYIPPDEINLIRQGADYGYPRFFGIPPADSGTEAPVIQIPSSSAPTGLMIYTGQAFPAEYRGAIFVALWGSSGIVAPTGHRVSVVPKGADGQYHQADLADFLTGTQNPVAVIPSPDGGMYVADYGSGWIYKITYAGP